MPNLAKKYKAVRKQLESYEQSVLCAPVIEKGLQDQLDTLWISLTEHARLEINRWTRQRMRT